MNARVVERECPKYEVVESKVVESQAVESILHSIKVSSSGRGRGWCLLGFSRTAVPGYQTFYVSGPNPKQINFLSSVCREASSSTPSVLARLETMEPATLYMAELDSPLLAVVGEAYRAASRYVTSCHVLSRHVMPPGTLRYVMFSRLT